MFRLVACLGSAVAVRRGGNLNDMQPSHRELLSSLLDQGKVFDARSFGQTIQGWTADWTDQQGNMSAIVHELSNTILNGIAAAHTATQDEVNRLVTAMTTAVGQSHTDKALANTSDASYKTCASQEHTQIKNTISEQNEYNKKVEARVEPCNQEISTAVFTVKSETDIEVSCNTSKAGDADCTNAIAELYKILYGDDVTTGIKGQMEAALDDKVGEHEMAEKACQDATTERDTQYGKITDSQGVWNGKHGACQLALTTRFDRFCQFGDSMHLVCSTKTEYDTLVNEVNTTGTIHSESDRKHEATVVQTVVCVLNKFIEEGSINDDDTTGCHAIASSALDYLTIDLKTNTWNDILSVKDDPNFLVNCANEFEHEFDGGKWDVPVVPESDWPVGYDYNTVSKENQTLSDYSWHETFTLSRDENNDENYFGLDECNN